ncbi:RNA polymerase sigma-70 factor [Bacillus sp. FJAT-29937]|uniref:RNA polymerase sigma-70 factor n=1 Tax=Bacillus sp. FJAT-29937 TaxID=1720553 RepID=UPI00082FD775|nr:RNA polymerase sigma-70 factor [Bacillus sp. FJAT-29937]
MEMAQVYQTYKPLLFSLAYRMLGSAMDAEDIVHEAFILLGEADNETKINNMKAYLCNIVTNRCIDKLRSAAKQREVYIGQWLPEPIIEDDINNPSISLDKKESISMAYLLLLQQLTEVERAVFLLREVFQYEYEDIASIVGKSSTNCRQIFHRAKKGILHRVDSKRSDKHHSKTYIEKFSQAVLDGDIDQIHAMLKKDAVFYSDGGGKVTAALRPIFSADHIARFLLGVITRLPENATYQFKNVNGSPGIVIIINGRIDYVVSIEVNDGKIAKIYMVSNPDKLIHLNK